MKNNNDQLNDKDNSTFVMVSLIFGAIFGVLAVPLSLFLFLKYF